MKDRKSKILADILLEYIDKMQGEDLLAEEDEKEDDDILAEPAKPKVSIAKIMKAPKKKG